MGVILCAFVRFGLGQWIDAGRNRRLYCNSSSTRWIASFLLVCGYIGMFTEEAWIGLDSISPFVQVSHELFVHFAHCGGLTKWVALL